MSFSVAAEHKRREVVREMEVQRHEALFCAVTTAPDSALVYADLITGFILSRSDGLKASTGGEPTSSVRTIRDTRRLER